MNTPFERILVPLDGSPVAEAALETAQYLARVCQSRLLLVRVPDLLNAKLLDWDEASPLQKALESECQHYLDGLAKPLREAGLSVQVVVLDPGPAAERILEFIDDETIDLVVLTSHGRGGLERVPWGSVADVLARNSHAPVMILGRRSDVLGRTKDKLKPVQEKG